METALVRVDAKIPENGGVAIEYPLSQRAQRIDWLITGEGEDARRLRVPTAADCPESGGN